MALPVGRKAFDLIVAEEDVSEAWYNANAVHPVWPGGASGVTFGIGYDAGQHSDSEILKDWLADLGVAPATALSRCAGVQGDRARTALAFVRGISVPWAVAMKVFAASTLPRYAAKTEAALPGCDKLPPDAFGALVSIGYNRGNDWSAKDDRHWEMADIRDAVRSGDYDEIPAAIEEMQRLWKPGSAVWKRRQHEADLFRGAFPPEPGAAS